MKSMNPAVAPQLRNLHHRVSYEPMTWLAHSDSGSVARGPMVGVQRVWSRAHEMAAWQELRRAWNTGW